jgi:hypothetical protein
MTGRTKTFGVNEKCLRFKIFPDAGSTPTVTSQGGVASVELTAAGKFTVTFSDAYLTCVEATATYSTSADNVDLYAQLGAISNLGTSTAATAVIKLKTGATNTNAAAAATDNFISCCFVFEDSSA